MVTKKINKTNKKAFTIIELVIVIGVIGILSAVLIPTFSNLMQKANVSRDTTLVRNLNTAINIEKVSGATYDYPQQAIDSVKKSGFSTSDLRASSDGNEILWDSANDLFCYYNAGSGSVDYLTGSSPKTTAKDEDLFKFYQVDQQRDNEGVLDLSEDRFSAYLATNNLVTKVLTNKGVDTGDCVNIEEVDYTNPTEKIVTIKTSSFGTTLKINAHNDTVKHYGFASVIDIEDIKSTSYHEYGMAGKLKIASGHAVVEKKGTVYSVIDLDGAGNSASIDTKGTVCNNKTEDTLCNGSNHTLELLVVDSNHVHEVCSVCGYINKIDTFDDVDWSNVNYEEVFHNYSSVNVLDNNKWTQNVISHTPVHIHDYNSVVTPPTCTEAGYTTHTCSTCNDVFVDTPVAALGHNYGEWNIINAASCLEAGSRDKTCSRCGHKVEEVISALGHDITHHDAQSATCLENGYAAYDTCSRCDYSTYTVIDATGHEWYSPTYTWNGDQCTATRICKHDALHTESETVTGVYHETQSATCTTASQGTLVATFTNPVFESQVTPHNGVNPAEGHTYVFDKIEWGDNHTAKAKYICNKDSNHIIRYDCTVTSDITPATCLAEGSATYTATYDIYEDVVHEVLPIDPNAPDASCPTYEWNQMNPTAASYYENVTYDLSNTTSQISSYMSSTSYRKDQPVGQTVDLVAGDLTVTDNGTGNSYTVSVSSGPYTFYNITPGVGGEFVVRRNNVVMQQGHLRPTGSLRMICSDTLYNIRDLGGWSVDNGAGTIKYNKIFRGGTPLAASDNDKNTWVKLTGIDYDLVLREQNGYPTTHSPLGDDIGVNFVTLSTAANEANMENITTARTTGKMGQIANYIFDNTIAGDTTYFHCLAGADRTGMVAIVVEGVLGMSPTDIEKEYELTSFAVDPSTRTRDGIRYHFNAINDYDGKTFRDRCINYLIDCGVTLEKINAFRNAMIEGTAKTITSSDLSCITNLHFNAYTMVGPGNQALEVGSVMHSVTNWGSYTSNPVEIKYGDNYQLFIRCDDGNKAFQNIKVFLYNSTSNAVTEIFTFGNMWKGYTKDITPSDSDSDRLIVQVAVTSLTIEEADSSIFLRTLVSDDTQSEITFTVGDVANPSVGGTINMNGSSNNYRCYSNVFDLTSSKKIVIANNTGASVGVLIFYGDSDSKCLVAPSITNISNGSTSEFYLNNANLAKARIKVRDSVNPASNPSSFTVYITNR